MEKRGKNIETDRDKGAGHMKIDACVFVGKSLYGNSLEPAQLLAEMSQYAVDQAVIRPAKPPDYCYDRANRYIAAVADKYPQLIGFGRVNPLEKTAAAQVEALAGYHLKGLHLHPWEDNFLINSPQVNETIAACQRLNLPVYVSTGYPCVSEALQLWELAGRFPAVKFIATHGAQLDMSGLSFDDALMAAERSGNIYFDLSGVYRRDFIERLIQTAGENRVLFGSCAPNMDMGLEIHRIEAAEIPETQKNMLFASNIQRILNFS
jgi:predicted TIM-barrel fold metal-dependent hydrolase